MNLKSLGFKKLASHSKYHVLSDDYGIRYNPVQDTWQIRSKSGLLVPFYPETEQDILDARRLFTKNKFAILHRGV